MNFEKKGESTPGGDEGKNEAELALETSIREADTVDQVLAAIYKFYLSGNSIQVGGKEAEYSDFERLINNFMTGTDADEKILTRNYGIREKVKELRDTAAAESRYYEHLQEYDEYLKAAFYDPETSMLQVTTFSEVMNRLQEVRQYLDEEQIKTGSDYTGYLRRIEAWERMVSVREENLREGNVIGFDVTPALAHILKSVRFE